MPTILDLTGQPVPAGVQGASVLPILDGAGQPPYVAFGESPQSGGQRFVALGGMAMVSGIARRWRSRSSISGPIRCSSTTLSAPKPTSSAS